MSDEEILPCVMCEQHHEQMLMLTCMHDPCINCAAVHYCSTQPNTSQVYVCAKCGEYTELDSSSVAELQRVYHLLKVSLSHKHRGRRDMIIVAATQVAPIVAIIPVPRICTPNHLNLSINTLHHLITTPMKNHLDIRLKNLIHSLISNTNLLPIHHQFPSLILLSPSPTTTIATTHIM